MCIRDRGSPFWLVLDGLALGAAAVALVGLGQAILGADIILSLIHISEPTRPY